MSNQPVYAPNIHGEAVRVGWIWTAPDPDTDVMSWGSDVPKRIDYGHLAREFHWGPDLSTRAELNFNTSDVLDAIRGAGVEPNRQQVEMIERCWGPAGTPYTPPEPRPAEGIQGHRATRVWRNEIQLDPDLRGLIDRVHGSGQSLVIGRGDPVPDRYFMPAGWEEIGWTEGSPIRQEIADAAETRLREQEVRYSYHDGPVTIDLHMEAVDLEAMAAWHYLFFGEPQPEREDTSSQADIVARISAEIDAWERDHGPGSAAITDLDDDYAPQRIGDVTDDPCGWRTL